MSSVIKSAYLTILAGGMFMKHIKMFHAALAALVTVLAGGYAQAEDAAVEDTPAVNETPAVTKVKRLKPKYTSVMTVSGYTGESELENFPVAVRISTANIPGFDYAKCDGEGDVTFTDNEGNLLPHEIEVWNTEGESVAWVSIPKLSTVVAEDNTTYTTFKMHWGHETKLADTKANEIWSTATYNAVWHMADDFNYEVGQHDSSGNGFTASYATDSNVGIGTVSAIGKAFYLTRDKNTEAKCFTTPNLSSTIKMNWSAVTLSGWAYYKGYAATGQQHLFWVYTSSSGSYYWGLNTQSKTIRSKFGTKSGETIGAGLNPASGWFHWAIRITNKTKFEYFLNGTLLKEKTVDAKYASMSTSSEFYCGGTTGYIDECRFRNEDSSDDWIKAEYDSINNKQFVVASEAVKNGYGLKIIVR